MWLVSHVWPRSTPGIASKGNQEATEWDEEACTPEQRKRVDCTTVAAAGGIKDNGKRALGGWADVYKVGNEVGELVFWSSSGMSGVGVVCVAG